MHFGGFPKGSKGAGQLQNLFQSGNLRTGKVAEQGLETPSLP